MRIGDGLITGWLSYACIYYCIIWPMRPPMLATSIGPSLSISTDYQPGPLVTCFFTLCPYASVISSVYSLGFESSISSASFMKLFRSVCFSSSLASALWCASSSGSTERSSIMSWSASSKTSFYLCSLTSTTLVLVVSSAEAVVSAAPSCLASV